jgi:iron complex transport system substrate-binding protein
LLYLRSSAFIGGFTALCITASTAASISLVDDLNRKVELKQPAQRIVSLAPFLTELTYSAGAGKKLVGASAYSDYPPEAASLPQVASAAGPEIEPLAALAPDLVLAWQDSVRPEDVERLGRLGIAVFIARAKRLEDPPRIAQAIARLAGTDASAAARDYRRRLQQLRAAHAGKARVRVFIEVWHQPLTSIGGTHWINEALAGCGAENVFADSAQVAPVVSWEELYRRDPDAILGAPARGREADFRASWQERATLRAVKEGRFVLVDGDHLLRPTLRLADGIAALCEGLDRARAR